VAGKVSGDLIGAVDAAAATFDGRGSQIKERELEMALEAALWTSGREPRRQYPIKLEQAWSGRVGPIDLTIGSNDGPILLELKWDPATLAAGAWDQVKLAAALQSGEGDRAFLIAGSPALNGLRGDELLEDSDVEPVALRTHYVDEFDYWKEDVKNHPRLAPAGWRTRRRHCASLQYKGEAWRIRLAELELTGSELVPFRNADAG